MQTPSSFYNTTVKVKFGEERRKKKKVYMSIGV
jgi:hypothetical protein